MTTPTYPSQPVKVVTFVSGAFVPTQIGQLSYVTGRGLAVMGETGVIYVSGSVGADPSGSYVLSAPNASLPNALVLTASGGTSLTRVGNTLVVSSSVGGSGGGGGTVTSVVGLGGSAAANLGGGVYSVSSSVFAPLGPSPGLAVSDYWFDFGNSSSLASDSNDGLTATTPLLTYRRFATLMGSTTLAVSQSVTLHVMSSQPSLSADPIVLSVIGLCTGSRVVVTGSLAQVATCTVVSASAKQLGSPTLPGTPWYLSGSTDLTQFIGGLVNDTTNNSWFWIDKVVSGKLVQVTQPLARYVRGGSAFVAMKDTVAVSDNLVVYSAPKVNCLEAGSPGQASTDFSLYVQNLWIVSADGLGTDNVNVFGGEFAETRISNFVACSAAGANISSFVNCDCDAGGIFTYCQTVGGKAASSYWEGFLTQLDGDVLLRGNQFVEGELVEFRRAYVDTTLGIYGTAQIDGSAYGATAAALWGPGSAVPTAGGRLSYVSNTQASGSTHVYDATTVLLLQTLKIATAATASALDRASGAWVPGLPLTAVNLSLPVVSGGFEGTAYGADGGTISAFNQVSLVPQFGAAGTVMASIGATGRWLQLTGDLSASYTASALQVTATSSLVRDTLHPSLRQLIHLADQGGPFEGFSAAVRDMAPGPFPTGSVWWTDNTRTLKVVEKVVTYNPNKTPSSIRWIAYVSGSNSIAASFTDAVSYSGVFELSRTRTSP